MIEYYHKKSIWSSVIKFVLTKFEQCVIMVIIKRLEVLSMKKIIKLTLLSVSVILLCSFMSVFVFASNSSVTDFSVASNQTGESSDISDIQWYLRDGKYYIFLPSHADRSNLVVTFNSTDPVYCGETQLENGKTTNVFANGTDFTLTCGDSSYQVVVMQGSADGSIFITTESGNMDKIHADKSYKESGNILIVDKDGEIEYDGILNSIKGRGNSTWNLDKKPYNIKLDSKADLFGMGKSKKWCLLANANDFSYMRNMLAYDFAQKMGIDVTSSTKRVDLYLNGEYAGLYLITEKVEIGSNRVDIYDLEGETEDVNDKDLDEYSLKGAQNSRTWGTYKYADIPTNPDEITGGYLLELEKIYRYVNEPSGFITDIGQAVVVKSPEYASKAQVEYISGYYQEFEEALYSSTGYNSLGKHYSDYIDVDSLAEMYVLDEFASNFDGCSSSFYLYKDVNGKLVAGPAWDFDLGFGCALSNDLINHVENVADPSLLYIQTCFIGNHNEGRNALLAQAFSHNDFQLKVQEIWNTKVKDYYPTVLNNIDTWSSSIVSSVKMDMVLWNFFGTSNTTSIENSYLSSVSVVRNYVTARYAYLSQAYSNDTYFVKYDIGEMAKNTVHDRTIYKSGDKAVILAGPKVTDSMYEFKGWSLNPDGSGQLYNEGDEITVTDNTKLYAVYGRDSSVNGTLKWFIKSISDFFNKIAEFFRNLFG